MLRKLIVAALTMMFATASGLALAAHGGDAGGKSGTHMSSEGVENTNGPDSADRDKGKARAEDRKSDKAADHKHQGKHKGGDKH